MYFRYLGNVFLLSVVVLGVSINRSLGSKKVACTPVGNCKCQFPNGRGVDLTLLRGLSFNVTTQPNDRLLFYPCKNVNVLNSTSPFNTTLNECELGASVCLERIQGNETQFLNFGNVTESQFDWKYIADTPYLKFKHLDRTTKIELQCNEGSTVSTLTVLTRMNNNYELRLSSEYACDTTVTEEGHSVFSTLFIIFLVLFFFYFFGGFLVLRFIRGARGWEAIPNGEFWKSLWLSFKKMCAYVINGCHHPEAYDTI